MEWDGICLFQFFRGNRCVDLFQIWFLLEVMLGSWGFFFLLFLLCFFFVVVLGKTSVTFFYDFFFLTWVPMAQKVSKC